MGARIAAPAAGRLVSTEPQAILRTSPILCSVCARLCHLSSQATGLDHPVNSHDPVAAHGAREAGQAPARQRPGAGPAKRPGRGAGGGAAQGGAPGGGRRQHGGAGDGAGGARGRAGAGREGVAGGGWGDGGGFPNLDSEGVGRRGAGRHGLRLHLLRRLALCC